MGIHLCKATVTLLVFLFSGALNFKGIRCNVKYNVKYVFLTGAFLEIFFNKVKRCLFDILLKVSGKLCFSDLLHDETCLGPL